MELAYITNKKRGVKEKLNIETVITLQGVMCSADRKVLVKLCG
jgi:hypothetical protein